MRSCIYSSCEAEILHERIDCMQRYKEKLLTYIRYNKITKYTLYLHQKRRNMQCIYKKKKYTVQIDKKCVQGLECLENVNRYVFKARSILKFDDILL